MNCPACGAVVDNFNELRDHYSANDGFPGHSAPTGDSTGTPGNATLHKGAGKSAIAAGASACVVTNSLVSATSLVLISPLDNDATLVTFKAAAGAGSFTVTGNAAATATWKFAWMVVD